MNFGAASCLGWRNVNSHPRLKRFRYLETNLTLDSFNRHYRELFIHYLAALGFLLLALHPSRRGTAHVRWTDADQQPNEKTARYCLKNCDTHQNTTGNEFFFFGECLFVLWEFCEK